MKEIVGQLCCEVGQVIHKLYLFIQQLGTLGADGREEWQMWPWGKNILGFLKENILIFCLFSSNIDIGSPVSQSDSDISFIIISQSCKEDWRGDLHQLSTLHLISRKGLVEKSIWYLLWHWAFLISDLIVASPAAVQCWSLETVNYLFIYH